MKLCQSEKLSLFEAFNGITKLTECLVKQSLYTRFFLKYFENLMLDSTRLCSFAFALIALQISFSKSVFYKLCFDIVCHRCDIYIAVCKSLFRQRIFGCHVSKKWKWTREDRNKQENDQT